MWHRREPPKDHVKSGYLTANGKYFQRVRKERKRRNNHKKRYNRR